VCTGIALTLCDVPAALVERHHLADRVYDRAGTKELQFHLWQAPALLPVQWEGRLQVLPWGTKERRGPRPTGGWITTDQLAAGLVSALRPEEAIIPANLGHHQGTWFVISVGIRGVVLPNLPTGPVVYMLVEKASNYYRNMTEQQKLMPVLVDQVI
jgi:hypothetical protein